MSIDCHDGYIVSCSHSDLLAFRYAGMCEVSARISLSEFARGSHLTKIHLYVEASTEAITAICIFDNGMILGICLETKSVLWTVDTDLAKEQIAFAHGRIILISAFLPPTPVLLRPTARPPTINAVNIGLSHIFATNQEFIFVGCSYHRDVLVWNIQTGEVLFHINYQDYCE